MSVSDIYVNLVLSPYQMLLDIWLLYVLLQILSQFSSALTHL